MEDRKVRSDGKFVLVAITMLVNVANYGLNLLLARCLGPAFFAEANLIATIVLIFSFIAVGVQLTVAKVVADAQQKYLYSLRLDLIKATKVAVVSLCVFAYPLFLFLNLSSVWLLVVLFCGLPFYLLMCFDRGQYQGKAQFATLGYTFLCEMLIRLVCTIGLVWLLPSTFASLSVVFGFVASFIVTQYVFKINAEGVRRDSSDIKSIYTFLKIITVYELSQILINNADIVLVNHLFEQKAAGLYAALAILGKAVFFATGIVVTVLFPKVIERRRLGLNHQVLFYKSLLIVFGLGMSMVLGSVVAGNQVVLLAFGTEYGSMGPYLWQYALLTCLFSCSNVFVYYHMTLHSYAPVFISVIAGLIQVGLVLVLGHSFAAVLGLQLLVMFVLFAVLVVYHIVVTTGILNQKIRVPIGARI